MIYRWGFLLNHRVTETQRTDGMDCDDPVNSLLFVIFDDVMFKVVFQFVLYVDGSAWAGRPCHDLYI